MNFFQDVVPKYPTACSVEWVDAEDPLFLLYTSGSTGKPKVLHLLLFWRVSILFFKLWQEVYVKGCSSYYGRIYGIHCNNIQVCIWLQTIGCVLVNQLPLIAVKSRSRSSVCFVYLFSCSISMSRELFCVWFSSGVQLTVAGLLGTAMSHMDLCSMERLS